MTDRKKMIAVLECCISDESCAECPYKTRYEYCIAEVKRMMKDALELLKAQKVAKDTAYNPWKNFIQAVAEETPDPCKNCSNHPSNGGSGICNCTLGLPKVTV